jgi:hypothetical protein
MAWHMLVLLLMNTNSVETGPAQPKKEKRLAIMGAFFGAILGAFVFGLAFMTPTLFIPVDYKTLIIITGVVMGIIHGGSAGPLVALRFSRGFERNRTSLPRSQA